jgi:hypothetical protein
MLWMLKVIVKSVLKTPRYNAEILFLLLHLISKCRLILKFGVLVHTFSTTTGIYIYAVSIFKVY